MESKASPSHDHKRLVDVVVDLRLQCPKLKMSKAKNINYNVLHVRLCSVSEWESANHPMRHGTCEHNITNGLVASYEKLGAGGQA